MPKIIGQVIEKWSGRPIVNALVNVNGASYLTNSNGYFEADVQGEGASISAMHKDHQTESAAVALSAGDNQVIIELKPVLRAL